MDVLQIVLGVFLLGLGRRLFWLFVGALGVIAGMDFAATYFAAQSPWLLWLLALAAGVAGAILALLLQHLAIVVAGFAAGAYGAGYLLHVWGSGGGGMAWVWVLLAGLIGALLMLAVFEWALIVLSSLLGAVFVVQGAGLNPPLAGVVLLALCLAGMVVQIWLVGRRPSTARGRTGRGR